MTSSRACLTTHSAVYCTCSLYFTTLSQSNRNLEQERISLEFAQEFTFLRFDLCLGSGLSSVSPKAWVVQCISPGLGCPVYLPRPGLSGVSPQAWVVRCISPGLGCPVYLPRPELSSVSPEALVVRCISPGLGCPVYLPRPELSSVSPEALVVRCSSPGLGCPV